MDEEKAFMFVSDSSSFWRSCLLLKLNVLLNERVEEMKVNVKSILFSLSLLISSISAHAEQYHYENLLVGGAAIGLSGSFVAIADDLSAMHYNPAGLVGQQSTRSASVNTMSWESTEFISAFNDGSDFSRDSFTVVPGFMG